MLVSGLRASREATELVIRGEDIGAFEDRIGKGVSANLCQATAKLINAGSGLDVSETRTNFDAAPARTDRASNPDAENGLVRRPPRYLRRPCAFSSSIGLAPLTRNHENHHAR